MASISSTSPFSSWSTGPFGASDSLDVLDQHYPEVSKLLKNDGFELAGPNLVGRCQSNATLFLEIRHQSGVVLAWIWDLKNNDFIGKTYEVRGPLGSAVEKARHLIESTFAQDHLSGEAPHYKEQILEVVFVA